jgi:threonine/homoserine/homoserine lactone efflux protein
MSLSGLLTFALVYFIFVLTPGPGVAATVARGLGTGLSKSTGYIAGFVLGDIIWFTIAATGLAALATRFETAFTVFKYLGCVYLLYMAWKIWSAPPHATHVEAIEDVPGEWAGFAGTLTLTLSNPKVIVFFLSLMPLVVDVQHITLAAYVIMIAVMATVCGGCIVAVLYLATLARRVFKSAKALQRINRTSAAMMAGAAVVIGVKN